MPDIFDEVADTKGDVFDEIAPEKSQPVNVAQYVAGGGPMAGMAMLPPAPDIPRVEGQSTAGQVGAAALNTASSLYNAAKSPLGLTLGVTAAVSPLIGAAAGVGFGLKSIYEGLNKVYQYGAGVGNLQSGLEGAGETGLGGLMALGGAKPLIDQAAKILPKAATEATKPIERTEPSASEISKTTEIHGDVRPQQEPTSPLPEQEGGKGVQPQTQAGVQQAQREVLLSESPPAVTAGEVVESPAIKLPSGKINTGSIHALIPGAEEGERGFVTNKGRFVTEDEADALPRKIIPMQPRGDLAASEISDPIRRESYLETEIKQSSNPSEIEDLTRELERTRNEISRLGYVRRGGVYEKVAPAEQPGVPQPSAGPVGATMETPVAAGETPQAMGQGGTVEPPKQVGSVTQDVTQTGLTEKESTRLKTLTDKMESGAKLTSAESKAYRKLIEKVRPPTPESGGISVGPGAASPGDIPKTSPLTQLSNVIKTQSVSPKEPLSTRIADAVDLAGKWARGKDTVTQGLAKARGAADALINAYVNLPKWTQFSDAIGKWIGADQKTALEVREFQKQINRAIPNKLRQEAITNWIQADGDEALLRQRAEASKPSVRRGYELALTLTEPEKVIARNIQSYLESRLDEGLKAGLLKQGVDNYVTQVWKRPTSATQKMWADLFGVGSLNPNFRFAKQRIFDSYFEGEQAGFIPKNKTISNLVSVYDLAFNRALSARALIKSLQEGKASDGMPITMTSGKTTPIQGDSNIPEAFLIKPNTPPGGAVTADGRPYRPIDHWALRDWKWATKGPQGQNVFVQGDMLVHPDHWEHLNNVLKTSRLQQHPVTGAILRGAALAKQTKLSLSPFHTVQEGVHAMAHRVNPLNPDPIDLNQPIQKSLVDHGLMVADPRAQELFAEGSTGGGLVGKIPGLGQLQQWYTEMTFRDYIPRLKMTMAKDAFQRNMESYASDIKAGKVTQDQIAALTAREANAAFGEQNYRMMGRSPNVQDFFRLALLAPDFLESRFRFVAQALKPYGREQQVALGLMAGVLYTVSRIINKATDDDYHWDKPFSVFNNGKEYRLRTILGDAQHLFTDPRSFWYNRMSPISRTAAEYVTGRDDRGIKRTSAEQFVDFLSWFKPIPTQIRSDQTKTQAALTALGVSSKTYGKQQEIYEIADKWMKNNPDPKVQARYKQARQETLPESPYRPLRDALNKDDYKAAKKAYGDLLLTHTPTQIATALHTIRPFTGSMATEAKFKQSLTPDQSKVYNAAIEERRSLFRKFIKMKAAQ